MRKLGRGLELFVLSLCFAGAAPGQATAGPAASLTFEVAAIHPSKLDGLNGWIKALPHGTGYMAQNVPVKLMISVVYKIPIRQILGGPEWLNSERFDVEAKTDGTSYSLDDLRTMYQNLLGERFRLKFHRETKEGKVYALKLAAAGLKMKPNTTPQDYNIPVNFSPDGAVQGMRVSMSYLCWFLGQTLQNDARPVANLTGLDGNYDFTLTFAPVLPPGAPNEGLPREIQDRPSIFDAVKQQLGLTLTPERGPVEFLVIDHVERPLEN